MKTFFYLFFIVFFTLTSSRVHGQTNLELTFLDGRQENVFANQEIWANQQKIVLENDREILIRDLQFVKTENRKFKVFHFPLDSIHLIHHPQENPILSEILIEGTIDLFAWQADQNTVYYYVKKDERIIELFQEKIEVDSKVGYKKPYIGYLKLLMNDCPKINAVEIDRLKFDGKSFKKIVSKYNSACGSLTYETKIKREFLIGVYPMIGYKISNHSFAQSLNTNVGTTNLARQGELTFNYPIYGLGLDVPISKKLGLYLNGSFQIDGHAFYETRMEPTKSFLTGDTTEGYSMFKSKFYAINIGIGKYHTLSNGMKIRFEYALNFRDILTIDENLSYGRRRRRPFYDYEGFGIAISKSYLTDFNVNHIIRLGLDWNKLQFLMFYQTGKSGITFSKDETTSAFGVEIRYRIPIRLGHF
jgi:hypothetical protein